MKPGNPVTLATKIAGGKAPYSYTITFPAGSGISEVTATSNDGQVSQKVPVPTTAHDGEITYTVKVVDADKNTAETAKDALTPITVKK